MPAFLQYEFMVRALIGGVLVGALAPVLGTFLVLRRFSLIADTLAHVALMGVAIGMATRTYPAFTALAAAVAGAIIIELLRSRRKLPGDVTLAIVLYTSLAVAVVIISASRGFNVDLFAFLFGSILVVSPLDVALLGVLTVVTVLFVTVFFVELAQSAFDEDLARASGVPVDWVNLGLAILTGATITLSMRVVGVLLVGAMIVVPVLAGQRLVKGLRAAIFAAVLIGVGSSILGLILAFYTDVSAGGATVLTAVAVLFLVEGFSIIQRRRQPTEEPAALERGHSHTH
ncbi:MAG: metal ABC transporter permease [Dehalococcoidia bacterium]